MKRLIIATLVSLAVGPAVAQTRVAVTTPKDQSGFVDQDQKRRQDAVEKLTKALRKHATEDGIVLVDSDAQVTITVTQKAYRPGGLIGIYAKGFGGDPLIVELRAGDYTRVLDEWHPDIVVKKVREWLKDNRAVLNK